MDSAAYGRRERDIEKRYDPRSQAPARRRRADAIAPPGVADLEGRGVAAEDHDAAAHPEGHPEPPRTRAWPSSTACPCVYVSNHGGRQLDHAPGTIEILAEVVEAVAGRAEVVVDGGFQRGTDVLKALALGARAVCIGKAAAWGLAAAGEEGVVRTLELLALELRIAMANTGQARLTEVSPDLVRRACVSV